MTAALLGISALALAVAAVSLLVPLQALLRRDAVRSLAAEARTARSAFAQLPAGEVRAGSPALDRVVRRLGQQTSAAVVVLDADGRVMSATGIEPGERFRDAALALQEGRLVRGTADAPETDRLEAHVAMPVESGERRYVVTLHRSLAGTGAAERVIARALLVSALIALVVALAAGAALAGRLVRRLTALRDTSLRLAELGPLAEVQDDGARDEVGDLTRAFASMQQRLREQEQARRTFVATASHELRTPMASLRLMLHSAIEELQATRPDLTDTREQLQRAMTQTDRLGALAGELLDLSRLDAGLPLRSERVELVELARSVIAELEPRANAAGVDLRLTGADSAWATADPGGVAQIIRILIDNALRYGEGAPIEVEIAAAGIT
ncbi:MAG TPA: HAMP domain-containing sensor histidine kinase, partial [Solirubrobacteraceae bacterium]|nr:HAMP domain-containing sensor histidine kinase [Solirubrobacteraceae bacterium]